jgi:hypothetical protein
MLGPPHRFCRILISRLIFFFLTGLRILTTHFWRLTTLYPSKTSLYFPRPILRTTS